MSQSDEGGLRGDVLAGATSRRRFLEGAGALAVAGGAVVVPVGRSADGASAARLAASAVADADESFEGVRVGRSDPRYRTLTMGFNQRWVGEPAYIQVVGSTGQVVNTLREAVRNRRRITVRGGGHCYEDFVSGNRGGVIIDLSQMHGVSRSSDGTFWLQGGCTNWDVYTELYKRFDVTLPGGSCYSVGLGGHVAGGGYGLLSRQFGLTVDYLSAVEVVVVNRDRSVSVVTATWDDPRTRDLVWGYSGGGGGNFGVITRYGFRRLPRPPQEVWLSVVAWDWDSITPAGFRALLHNYGRFMATNSRPGSPYSRLFSLLKLTHRSAGQIVLVTQISGTDESLLESFLAQISRGVGTPVAQTRPVGCRAGDHAVCGQPAHAVAAGNTVTGRVRAQPLSCALPAARRDGPGVAGFVREQKRGWVQLRAAETAAYSWKRHCPAGRRAWPRLSGRGHVGVRVDVTGSRRNGLRRLSASHASALVRAHVFAYVEPPIERPTRRCRDSSSLPTASTYTGAIVKCCG